MKMNYLMPSIDSCIKSEQLLSVFAQYALENNTTFDFRQCENLSDGGVRTTTNNVLEGCVPIEDPDRTLVAGDKWLFQCQGDSDSLLLTIESVEASGISCGGYPHLGAFKIAYVSDKPFPQYCIITGMTAQQDCWINLDICTEDDQAACH